MIYDIKFSHVMAALENFLPKATTIFITTSHYRRHLAIVWHNTNFATVHSRVIVGGCSVEYEYKFPCQFARIVAQNAIYQ